MKFLTLLHEPLLLVSYTSAIIVIIYLLLTNSGYNEAEYTAETEYTRWVTPLPAFSICSKLNKRSLVMQIGRLMQVPVTSQHIDLVSKFLQPGKYYCPSCDESVLNDFLLQNVTIIADMLKPNCESELLRCTWNDVEFPCCQYFKRIKTRFGECYSLNSEQTEATNNLYHRFETKFSSPRAILSVKASRHITVSVHDRKDIPSAKNRMKIRLGERGEIHYKFQETTLSKSSQELSVDQRQCTLDTDLTTTSSFKTYSKSTCLLQCIAQLQIESCRCKHHLLPGPGIDCSMNQLSCLDQRLGNMTKKEWKLIKEKCKCLQQCEIQDIQTVFTSVKKTNENNSATITMQLTKPPTERIILRARTTAVETIVAVACLSRLITNATLYEIIIELWRIFMLYKRILFGCANGIAQLVRIE